MNETIITDGLGSVRTEAAPRRTITAYKLMRLVDGKLYPLYIDRSEPVELGVWYNADSVSKDTLESLDFGYHLIDLKTERVIESRKTQPTLAEVKRATACNYRWFYIVQMKTKIGYKNVGIAESKGKEQVKADYALRPGWHAGQLPVMNQVAKGANKDILDDSFVFTEIEISADVDYNAEAQANGGELYYIPENGYYLRCTNANKKAAQADKLDWYIAGAIRINRIISDSEARDIIDRYNREHGTHVAYSVPRESGKQFNADTMSLQGTKKAGTNPALNNLHCSLAEPNAQKRGIEDCKLMRLGGSNGIVPTVINATKIVNNTLSARKKIGQYFNHDYREEIPKSRVWGSVMNWFCRLFSLDYDGQSYYGYYNTPKGIMDFRVANHNAKPGNFKEKGKDVNISVYVAVNEYNLPDDDVDYIEYRYSKEDYAAHTDEIIKAIIKGFRNALKTGHFVDCTYLATAIPHKSSATKKGNLQTFLPKFKHWFGDWENSPQKASKVMADGKPLVVYHGTPDGGFTTFANTKTEDGYWFTNDYNLAYEYSLEDNDEDEYPEDAQIYEVYLNMRNPIVLDAKGQTFDKMERAIQLATLNKSADGVIVKNIIDAKFNNSRCKPATTYFVKHPNQIKSATRNNGNFSPESDNILEGISGTDAPKYANKETVYYSGHAFDDSRPEYKSKSGYYPVKILFYKNGKYMVFWTKFGARKQFYATEDELSREIPTAEPKPGELTEAEKEKLRSYQGKGGKGKETTERGILDEYYTPDYVCEFMYQLAVRYGYTAGKVLEPSCATGNCIRPIYERNDYTHIDAFEINQTSREICKKLYPNVTIYENYFETAFLEQPRFSTKAKKTWLENAPYDLIIGNPPYGKHVNRYSSYFGGKDHFEQIEMFFMAKALELLRSGGLLIYITSTNFMSTGVKYQEAKLRIGAIADFVDAYRLPKVFANTDICTDIIVLRKK